MALENIANSDALYRNVEQTILVTLVGQEILRGKHIREGGVSCEDWLHFITSLLCHNIGYIKGVCRCDRNGYYATGTGGNTIPLPEGATDASLTPYRVDRAKLFVDERFGGHKIIDVEQIKRNIEATRFPLHPEAQESDSVNYPGLVRAASLIGQIADPRYLKKSAPSITNLKKLALINNLATATQETSAKTIPNSSGTPLIPTLAMP